MRILVFSDSHGDSHTLLDAVNKHPSAGLIIHLGDGEYDLLPVSRRYPEKVILAVRGNGDFASRLPCSGFDIVEDKRIFFTHGHLYHVKFGLSDFLFAARDNKADIALFGHTHEPESFYEDGLYVLNPGSISRSFCGRASYGIIDIATGGIHCHIAKI